MLISSLIPGQLLIRQIHFRQPPSHRLRICAHNTAVAPHLALLVLDVGGRALAGDGVFVAEDEDGLVFAEEAVDVFEFAAGGCGVEPVSRETELLLFFLIGENGGSGQGVRATTYR